MRKIISIVSGKGGVGKTITAINLGMALQELGEESIVIDTDLKNPNLGVYLGLYQFPTSINEVLEKEINVLEALHIHPSGLRLIPASISLAHLGTNPSSLGQVFRNLDSYIIMDCAPGFGEEMISSVKASDEVLIVTNPLLPAVSECMRLADVVRSFNKKILGIIVNNTGIRQITKEEIESVCNAKVIGDVPRDINVEKSVVKKMPVVKYKPYSPASLEFCRIATKICGKDYTEPLFPKARHILSEINERFWK